MALKTVVDDINSVPEAFRKEYEQKDGKFYLSLDGQPAGFVAAADLALANGKVVEFRDKNIALMQEVEPLRKLKTDFDGIDAVAAKDALAKAAQLKEKGVTKADDVAKLVADSVAAALKPVQDQLAQSEAARKADNDRANRATMRQTIGEQFTKIGGKAKALDFVLAQAESVFEVRDGQVVAKANQFSAANPGNPLPVTEWLGSQARENDFAFEPSNGGGANPKNNGNGGGARPGQTILKNPSPAQLGAAASDIADGKVRVEYDQQ
jgi:hypothetical protein